MRYNLYFIKDNWIYKVWGENVLSHVVNKWYLILLKNNITAWTGKNINNRQILQCGLSNHYNKLTFGIDIGINV